MINTEPAVGSELSPELGRTITAASDIYCLPRQREIQVERGAFPVAALLANLPRMLLDDSVGYGQAQPGAPCLAFPRRCFGGEEWIVDPVDVLLRNPGSGVGYHHAHTLAIGCRDA